LPALRSVEPRIYETLLAPWHVKGEPIGSLWAIKHTPEGQFDAEDARLLQSLARFAAAAYQMSDALDGAKAGQEALRRSEERFRLLSETIERLSTASDREKVLATVFRAARALTAADGVSLVVREGDQCHYIAEDAVGPLWSGQHFPLMSCVSGLAMVDGHTIVIPDIAADARVPQAAYEPTFVKSLLMVPISNDSGAAAIGAYWARVRTPEPEEVEVLEALSRVAGARLLKREAEERLQESEERFRNLVESSAQAVWETDAEGKAITDSPSWRTYTGQSQEEYLGSGWANAIHPDDRAAVQRLWCEAVRERRSLNTEYRLRRAGGGWRWTNDHAAPLLAPDGTVRKWVGMNIDITARKEAEEALRASEERFRAVAEQAEAGIVMVNTEGQVIFANDRFGEIVRRTRDKLVGKTVGELTHPEDWGPNEPLLRRMLTQGEPFTVEKRYVRPDGSPVWVRNAVSPRRDTTGQIVGGFAICIDITERKQAEEALRKSEERFQYCARATRDIIWDIDLVADRVWWSDAMQRQLGYAPENIGPDTAWCFAHMHPDDRERVVRGMREAAAGTGDTWSDEFRYRRADDSYATIADRGFIIRDARGRAVRMIGAMQDISVRKQAEEALRASESRARLLLGELQHRVRNTLSVIRSITRRTAETSQSVEDYAMHLDGRINAFARVQTAVARDPTAGLDLTDLVADELLTYAAHQGEQVRITGPAVRLQPKAAEMFGLAVHELATNAVKHGALTVPQGRIQISWRVQNSTEVPRLVFEWKESGTPNRAAKRERRGFGTNLLERTLTYELKAKTVQTFEPDGLRCMIELPMTERLVMGNAASTPQED
jgi:PAS domain S-box-containing protein